MNTESAVHHNTGPPATADPTYSGGDTQLRLKLSVLQADGLKYQDIAYSGPVRFVDKVKHVLEKKGRFFVTATDGVRTQVTAAVKGKHGSVKWNETLGDLWVPQYVSYNATLQTIFPSTIDSSSRLALRIFLRRESLRDVQVSLQRIAGSAFLRRLIDSAKPLR
ncbi:hypothetical protein BC834DRAFT_847045 [Gloeopeniophorella convolvens]|nr:hypothetical protein BC834DRAFT_847045 [Gloeopeniophorella convolvens]